MITRRHLMGSVGAGAALAAAGLKLPFPDDAQAAGAAKEPGLPAGTRSEATLEALPGKKPLIKLSYRPPNYETPIEYFRTPITPNDAFFVRYHLSDIPEVDANTWKLAISGDGAEKTAELTFNDLKAMPATEVVAVNQCSGNRRGLFQPHVFGVEWGYGAMGCARWKGVKLKDVLAKAGLKKDAVEIAYNGADGPPFDKTPDFVKSIPAWKALEDTTLIAYEMNGAPLPHFNGFPARLIVPGWTGTYWMKHIVSLEARMSPLHNFWMTSAYRVPLGKFPMAARFTSQEAPGATATPITEMVVNSILTSHADGAKVKRGGTLTVGGIAWDGGYGIANVEVSTDGGRTWTAAKLGENLGPYAFHPFSFAFSPKRGANVIMARATNKIGQGQTTELVPNGAGYHHNLPHRITLNAA